MQGSSSSQLERKQLAVGAASVQAGSARAVNQNGYGMLAYVLESCIGRMLSLDSLKDVLKHEGLSDYATNYHISQDSQRNSTLQLGS